MLRLQLLGSPCVELDGEVIKIKKHKNWLLLFFLAVEGKPHSREKLAELFWPVEYYREYKDGEENKARVNLRNTLHFFKNSKKLKKKNFRDRFLTVTSEDVSFNMNSDHWLDVNEFRRLLLSPSPRHKTEGIALYQGEFLSNVDIHVDMEDAENWRWNERLRLTTILSNGLQEVAKQYEARSDYKEAITYLRKLLTLDVENESENVHCQLMRLYALAGNPESSTHQYNECCRMLEEKFAAEPQPETIELLGQIKQNNIPTLPSVPFQAPHKTDCFVGRAEQLKQLADDIAIQRHKRVAIWGMGGLGKTTFTTHLAHEINYDFADGILWADVSYSDPIDIIEGWAEAYQYDFRGLSDIKTRSARWRDVINQKNALLVLDSVTSYDEVEPLIPSTGDSVIVITTRDQNVAMRFAGDNVVELDVLSDTAGLQLLTEILGEERVQAKPKELESAKKLCNLLGNLPLALEILAFRLKSRPRKSLEATAALLENLVSSLKQLQIDNLNLSVRASFELSWKMLDADQQQVYMLMGLFKRLNFSPESLAYVADEEQLLIDDHLEDLAALSLVNYVSNSTYYRQHALLADFACEKLNESKMSVDLLRQRFADYYFKFAQENQENYDELELIWPNLQRGLEVAHNLGVHELVCDYAETLTPIWFHRARFTEAREAYKIAHESATIFADDHRIAAILLAWGRACYEQDDWGECEKHLSVSHDKFTKLQDISNVAESELQLGRFFLACAGSEEAHDKFTNAKNNKLSIGEKEGVLFAEYYIAVLYGRDDRLDESKKIVEKLLEEGISQYIGLNIAVHRLMGSLCIRCEQYDMARQYLDTALRLSEEAKENDELTSTLHLIVALCRFTEDFIDGEKYAYQCIELCKRVGTRKHEAITRYELAQIYWNASHNFQKTQSMLEEAILLQREIDDKYHLVHSLGFLGMIYKGMRMYEEAQSIWEEALAIAKASRHPGTMKLIELLRQLRPAE